jgi:pimeloyl-ACP methyl ester carboxylesterase
MMETIGTAHETEVDGTSIAWTELGDGHPVVLLHGLVDSHRTWRRAAPLLAREFRVIMPDLPGHGWSGRPDAPYTLDWHARIVARWMDAIGVAKAHVCGHSFGGGIAQWMLLNNRSRVDRLALVAPGGLGRGVTLSLKLATFPLLGPALTPPVLRIGVFVGSRFLSGAFGGMEPREAQLFIHMCGMPGTARAFRRSVAGVVNLSGQYVQTIERVHEINPLPAIALFWGAEDPVIPVGQGASFLDLFTGVTLTTYPGCGHFPQLATHSAFARDLVAFLSDPLRSPAALRPRNVEEPLSASADSGCHRPRPIHEWSDSVLHAKVDTTGDPQPRPALQCRATSSMA